MYLDPRAPPPIKMADFVNGRITILYLMCRFMWGRGIILIPSDSVKYLKNGCTMF